MRYLLMKYNNYYNRRIKVLNSIEEYKEATEDCHKSDGKEYNFNEKDNLLTTITYDWNYSWLPDYLVTYTGETDYYTIVSRWFIIKSEKNRKGQYKFTLKRDIIADDYNNLSNNKYNVIRCNMDANNPLIYNKESFNYNQIKVGETPIYDETLCPWIVGYMPKGQSLSKITVSTNTTYDIDLRTVNHSDWDYYKYLGNGALKGGIRILSTNVPVSRYQKGWVKAYAGTHCYQNRSSDWTKGSWMGTEYEGLRVSSEMYDKVINASRHEWLDWDNLDNLIKKVHPEWDNADTINQLWSYNGNKVLFKDGVYTIGFSLYGTISDNTGNYDTSGVDDEVTQYVGSVFKNKTNGEIMHQDKFGYAYSYYTYKLVMTKVEDAQTISFEIPSTSNNLTDAPYKLFCIPYPIDDTTIALNENEMSKSITELVYNNIIAKTTTGTGTDTLYDIQILPYCPIKFKSANYTNLFNLDTNVIEFNSSWQKNVDYSEVTNGSGEVKGYIFYPTESSFTFSISKVFKDKKITAMNKYFTIDDIKVSNETEFIRMVSPNYSGQYEMSLAKNKGLEAIQVMCTYKPYNPFIEVQPAFGGLYGSNYEDARGLICTGDFSLPIVNDAWVSYELNNKTYQQAFNREVQHMEVSNDINKQNQLAKSITGVISAGTTGAAAGSMVGGIPGAIVGGTIGAGASAVGGVLDYNNLIKQQKEDLSYKKDMYNYSLQNIQALPTSLSKTSSLNANSKYVPFIESYSCTSEEKELLKDYLTYNGMTAGYTGTFGLSGYVEANIVKYNGDLLASELAELNNELAKGVYFE